MDDFLLPPKLPKTELIGWFGTNCQGMSFVCLFFFCFFLLPPKLPKTELIGWFGTSCQDLCVCIFVCVY
jgi:hypothetical protein